MTSVYNKVLIKIKYTFVGGDQYLCIFIFGIRSLNYK